MNMIIPFIVLFLPPDALRETKSMSHMFFMRSFQRETSTAKKNTIKLDLF